MLFNEKILNISKKKKESVLQRNPFQMTVYKAFLRYGTTIAQRIILEISINIHNSNKTEAFSLGKLTNPINLNIFFQILVEKTVTLTI